MSYDECSFHKQWRSTQRWTAKGHYLWNEYGWSLVGFVFTGLFRTEKNCIWIDLTNTSESAYFGLAFHTFVMRKNFGASILILVIILRTTSWLVNHWQSPHIQTEIELHWQLKDILRLQKYPPVRSKKKWGWEFWGILGLRMQITQVGDWQL